MVVERSKGEPQEFASHLQSVVWGAASIGGLIAAFLSGYLLTFMTDRQVFLLMSLLPLTLIGLGLVAPDKKVTDRYLSQIQHQVFTCPTPSVPEDVCHTSHFHRTEFRRAGQHVTVRSLARCLTDPASSR